MTDGAPGVPAGERDERPVLDDEELNAVSGAGGVAPMDAATLSGALTAIPSNCDRCSPCVSPGTPCG